MVLALHRIKFPAHRHIKENTVAGFINAKGFAFFVDMLNHLTGHFKRVKCKIPFPAPFIFKFIKKLILINLAA